MTEKDIKERAYQIYAALGELGIKRKQQVQILEQIDEKVSQLENQLVELSKVQPTPEQKKDEQ